jgi:hypothetical protein
MKLFLVVPDVGNGVQDDLSDNIRSSFPVVRCAGFMVVTLSFTHLSITFSNQKFINCSLTVCDGFVKLTSHRTTFVETGLFKMNI